MSKKTEHAELAAKKAAVLGVRRSRRMPQIAVFAAVALLAAAGLWYFGSSTAKTQTLLAASARMSGDVVSIPVSTFDDGRAHYFEHQTGGIPIRYFVLKSPDGILRAAFDACDVCWPAGKGYAQDGDFMVCRNCGQRFHSTRVNEVKGGCNPAPLERRVENGALLIRVSDILEGKIYFDFSRKA